MRPEKKYNERRGRLMDELSESGIDKGFLQRPMRKIRDAQGSGGEKGVINRNLCKHIIGAETRRIWKTLRPAILK